MAQKSNFIVRGGLDVSDIQKGLVKTQNQLKGFQSKISGVTKAIGAAFAAISIGSLVKDSVAAAMSVESSMNQLSRIMGDSSSEFNKWAQNQAGAYGIAREEAYKYGATYGNLISTFSSGTKETEQRTTQLLKASAVVASATGRTIEDTMERIRSGLLGNTESIEDLGINVNVAMLQSTKAFQQFANGKTWNQLTFQEQQQIRLMAILEQANTKYGDSLAGTTATRQQQFLATLKNIRLNLGQAFLPIYNVILPILNSLASKLEVVTATFASFMKAVFGKSIDTSVVTSAATAANSLADSTAGVGTAATGAAAAIKKSLAGFDQINQLSDNSSSDSSGSGSSGTSSSSSTTPSTSVTDSVSAWDGAADKLKPLQTALENLKTAFAPFADKIGQGLKWFHDDVLIPVSKIVITETVPEFLDALASAIKVLDTVAGKLQSSGAAKAIGDLISSMEIKQTNNATEWFKSISDALDSLNTFIDKPNIKNFGTLIDDITTAFLKSPINWTPFKIDTTKLLEGLKADFETVILPFQVWLDKSKKDWIGIKAYWATKWDDLKGDWKALTDNVEDKTAKFKAEVKTLPRTIKGDWEALKDSFKEHSVKFNATVETTVGYIQGKWNDLKGSFKNWNSKFGIELPTVDKIQKAGENLVSAFVKGLKSIKLPKLKISIGTSKTTVLGKDVSIPKIDVGWYAKGGVFDSPSLIGVGEAGKEAVMPLEHNTGWITDLASKVSDRMDNSGSSGMTEATMYRVMSKVFKEYMNLSFYIGDEDIASHANRGNASLGRRYSPVNA